jgi:3',5'-cyclic AMP phosphodiesterase CpdA
MRIVVHISDLHFGTQDPLISEGLIVTLNEIKPDLLIVSGDLTQRARRIQFIVAKEYLDRIRYPKIVIPGNHDIPLFDIFRRIFFPLNRYKKIISEDLSPLFLDEEMVVLGINTARSFTWKNGRISVEQIMEIQRVLCPISNRKIKIIVTHHPFIPPPGDLGIDLVGRSLKALRVIDECSVDLLLAGHLHQGYSGDIRKHYPSRERSVISIQAGTAVSRRTRKENNAFNTLYLDAGTLEVRINIWNGERFEQAQSVSYTRDSNSWTG